MKTQKSILERFAVLDLAIAVGLIAIFLATAIPLTRGAMMRNRMAECARKVQRAADAFDLYARALGDYPPNQTNLSRSFDKMRGVLCVCDIDWWDEVTEMGGSWEWYRDENKAFSIVICNPRASESQMEKLDALLDDGDLRTGLFKRSGSMYCYRLSDGNV